MTYLIGDQVFGGTATWGELLRTPGLAQAPGLLYILGIIPRLGANVRAPASVWVDAARTTYNR